MVAILYEAVHVSPDLYRRAQLPKDPNPAWFGYSVGKWDGDAFVVTSTGFNDNVWLDNGGRPATGSLRVTEKFVRKNFGRWTSRSRSTTRRPTRAVDRHAAAGVSGGHGAARIHLQREQQATSRSFRS